MKVLYLSLFVVLGHASLHAQLSRSNEVNILSPKAASIMKYGDHPVSLHTGLIDISVPVYTIEAKGLSVPITLKYHASGLKFDDVSNEVGLGWSLVAGGLITRSFKGAEDGRFGTFSLDVTQFKTCDNDPSPLTNEYVRLREVENGSRGNFYDPSLGRLDGEMDVYSFSFLNHSGSFCFPFSESQVGASAPSTGLFIPASGMIATSHNNQLIELVDADGVYYKFEVKDVDQNESYKEYYLTQIISSDKADTIDFIYEVMSSSFTEMRRPYINYTGIVTTTFPIGLPQHDFTESGGIFYQSLRPPRLTRINFTGGYVTFEYAVVNSIPTWDLQTIKIHNHTQTTPLRTVSLVKSLFDNGEQRLDKVTFNGSGVNQNYDYQFGYNGQPDHIFSGAKGIDFWGYFNGASVPWGKRYVPEFDGQPPPPGGSTTDRNANEWIMQRGILNKITYPTKGYSEFTYEAHKAQYSLGTPVVTCGGLRISEIKNYLPDGSLAEKKWYKYGQNESGLGVCNAYPSHFDFVSDSRVLVMNGGNVEDVKLIKRYSSFPKISYFLSGSSVVYTQVTEYVGTSVLTPTGYVDQDRGKTVYQYEVFPDEKIYVDLGNSNKEPFRVNSPNAPKRTYPWKSGNLSAKTVYKKEGSTYRQVSSLRNSYMDINTAEFRNVRVLPNVEFETLDPYQDPKKNFCSLPNAREYIGANHNPDLSPYDYFNYYTNTGLRVLTTVVETTDGVSSSTTYNSYNATGLPTSTTHITSAGEIINTALKYPTEFTYSPYTDMKSANILTPVVEKTISKNDNQLKKEVFRYGFWHSRFFALSSYEEGYRNESPVTRVTYNYNSQGNIQEIVKVGSIRGVYLWGYGGQYPIAHIMNKTYDEVKAVLGQALIDRVANAYTPAAADLLAINNLRINPSFQVRTYTYRHLLGMATQTDLNGLTTYYEYDSFGRLKYIEDNDRNLLQKYDYNYKQP